MPSASLLAQSILSGILIGGLYTLLGLGLSLSWRFLQVINLAHFAFVFLAAYLSYQLIGVAGLNPGLALLILLPIFFLIGIALQYLLIRFSVNEFASLLVTFGILVLLETLIQWIWSADFRRLETSYGTASIKIGAIYVPIVECLMFFVAVIVAVVTWAWLKFTYVGKALRASAENPIIAGAYGVNHKRLAYLIAGISGATAAIAGVFIALISTLAPAQVVVWLGVVFAAVILGGLGNPLGLLVASLVIGVSEAITMAVTAPTWAPLVSFTLLIAILILRPHKV
ncbi:MAG: branched-chain amino acid ABC transporter permease [Betaproteobacteria bacterium]|nr:branched-chain amino acid ABC transporter permease [Betaproteobacteria bacterium]